MRLGLLFSRGGETVLIFLMVTNSCHILPVLVGMVENILPGEGAKAVTSTHTYYDILN